MVTLAIAQSFRCIPFQYVVYPEAECGALVQVTLAGLSHIRRIWRVYRCKTSPSQHRQEQAGDGSDQWQKCDRW